MPFKVAATTTDTLAGLSVYERAANEPQNIWHQIAEGCEGKKIRIHKIVVIAQITQYVFEIEAQGGLNMFRAYGGGNMCTTLDFSDHPLVTSAVWQDVRWRIADVGTWWCRVCVWFDYIDV